MTLTANIHAVPYCCAGKHVVLDVPPDILHEFSKKCGSRVELALNGCLQKELGCCSTYFVQKCKHINAVPDGILFSGFGGTRVMYIIHRRKENGLKLSCNRLDPVRIDKKSQSRFYGRLRAWPNRFL